MRIGDVNKDNYMDFMKLFGGKNSKALDSMLGKDKKTETTELTEEEVVARRVKSGRAEDGMYVGGSDKSWQKIVPVSDEVKDEIIESVRKWFAANGNGMTDAKGRDGDERGAIMKEYRKNIPPSERLSVTWTLSQISQTESQRLIDYVKANQPGWDYGQKIDKQVLADAVSGNRIDIKA